MVQTHTHWNQTGTALKKKKKRHKNQPTHFPWLSDSFQNRRRNPTACTVIWLFLSLFSTEVRKYRSLKEWVCTPHTGTHGGTGWTPQLLPSPSPEQNDQDPSQQSLKRRPAPQRGNSITSLRQLRFLLQHQEGTHQETSQAAGSHMHWSFFCWASLSSSGRMRVGAVDVVAALRHARA